MHEFIHRMQSLPFSSCCCSINSFAPVEFRISLWNKVAMPVSDVSFVICSLQPAVQQLLDKKELLEVMNTTPSESEAWDIVQMEEIERELLGDE